MSALCVGPCRPDTHGGPRATELGHHLCPTCQDRIRTDLGTIADVWDDLDEMTAAGGGSGLTERVTTTKEHGIRLNERAVDVQRDAVAWLWWLARVVVDERHVTGPRVATAQGVARWLSTTHSAWLGRHPDELMAATISGDAREHARACRSAARPSGIRRHDMPELPCQEDGCEGTMYALIQPDDTGVDDLRCTVDRDHCTTTADVVTVRRRQALDPEGVAALMRRLAG